MDYIKQLQHLTDTSHASLAQKIGISSTTLNRILAGNHISQQTENKVVDFLHKNIDQAKLFLDETYVGNMDHATEMNISCVFAITSHAFHDFKKIVYPLGWRKGDEVKAAGKDIAMLGDLLSTTKSDELQTFYTKTLTKYNEVAGLQYLCPYILAVMETLETISIERINDLEIVIDTRSEFFADNLTDCQKILATYLPLIGCHVKELKVSSCKSRDLIGLQYADFVANLSTRGSQEILQDAQINPTVTEQNIRDQKLLMISGLHQRTIRHALTAGNTLAVSDGASATIEYLLNDIRQVAYQERFSDDRIYFNKLKQALKLCIDNLPNKNDRQPILSYKGTRFIDLEARACMALHTDLSAIELETEQFNQVKELIDSL